MAKEDGVVISKSTKQLKVRYKSSEEQVIKIGNQYGRMEGTVYPHFIHTDLAEGHKFKANEPLAYNTAFFERDWLDTSRLIYKTAKTVTVALSMTTEVFEDSSAISKELSEAMSSYVIKEKMFVIDFTKNIIDIVPVGSTVEPTTSLFTVLEDSTDISNLPESSIALLKSLANLSPKAKVYGTLERYEVKYNGDISDMSSTLARFVKSLDKQTREELDGTFYQVPNNRVNSEYRSEGKNLLPDTLELKVFIKVKLKQGVGDKGVLAGQMKSVVSDVFTSDVRTTSGDKIDIMFSYKGILNRVVNSPILMGTTIKLLRYMSTKVADKYFN